MNFLPLIFQMSIKMIRRKWDGSGICLVVVSSKKVPKGFSFIFNFDNLVVVYMTALLKNGHIVKSMGVSTSLYFEWQFITHLKFCSFSSSSRFYLKPDTHVYVIPRVNIYSQTFSFQPYVFFFLISSFPETVLV